MLKSTLEAIYDPKLNCSLCLKKTTESYRETKKNCSGKTNQRKELKNDVFYTSCPGNFYNSAYAELLDLHKLYRIGVFAYPGGILDQPSKYLSFMEYVESYVSKKEKEHADKLRKQWNKNNGKRK